MILSLRHVKQAALALAILTLFSMTGTFLWNLYDLKFSIRKQVDIDAQQRVQNVDSYVHDLQLLLRAPFNIYDFGHMGERISLFSKLATEVTLDKSLSQRELMDLLKKYFPWWMFTPSVYLPWAPPAGTSETTGIVISAGSGNMVFAIHLIHSLRNVVHSKLPITIAYAGDNDLSFSDRVKLTSIGPDIDTLNILDAFDDAIGGLQGGGWGLKPFSILGSRYQRVIMADADAIFLKNPDYVFETEPGLIDTGTLFWHDRFIPNGDDGGRVAWFKEMMHDKTPSAMLNSSLFWHQNSFHEMDSSCVIMDKGRPNVFMSLVFATWMNTEEVRREVTYQKFHGDKETFWVSAELSGSPYYFNPGYASMIGHATDDSKVCSSQALHLNHKKKPFWLNGSIRANKDVGQRALAKLTHWIGGAWNMTNPIEWQFVGADDGGWCVPHAEKLWPNTLEGTEYTAVIKSIHEECKKVDDKYMGKEEEHEEEHEEDHEEEREEEIDDEP